MDLAQNEFAVRDQNNNAGEKYVEVQVVSSLFLVTQVVAYYNNYLQLLLNPLLPNISMYILHTLLYKLPKVLTRRICVIIKSFFSC